MEQEKTTTMADGNVGKVTALPAGCTLALFDSSGGVTKIDAQKFMELVRGSIQIGGRNLLKGTSEQWTEALTSNYAATFDIIPLESVGLKPGDVVTLQMEIRNSGAGKQLSPRIEFINSDEDRVIYRADDICDSGERRIAFSAIVPQKYRNLRLGIDAVRTSSTITQTTQEYYRRIKLERGNVATDWTPAPEDFGGGKITCYTESYTLLLTSPLEVAHHSEERRAA